MAITIINTQGTKITVETKDLECPQIIGDLDETRDETEYGCISSDEVYVALGKITRAPFTLQVLYKAEGTDGQKELDDAFYDIIEKEIVIELSDGASTKKGTLLTFKVMVSGRKMGMPVNGAITMDYTAKIVGSIVKTAAAA